VHQLSQGGGAELFAEFGGGGDQQGAELVRGLGAGLDRRSAGDLQGADELDVPVGGFGLGGGGAGHDRAGGGLGVDGVALALPPAGGAVRSVDLDDPVPGGAQVPGQAGAPAAGALDPERLDRAESDGPPLQVGIPGRGRRRGPGVEPPAELVEGDRDVQVGVGVDADGDGEGGRCEAGSGHCGSSGLGGQAVAAPTEAMDRTATGPLARLLSGHTLARRCRRSALPGRPTVRQQGTSAGWSRSQTAPGERRKPRSWSADGRGG
jgi:hypothetical protein